MPTRVHPSSLLASLFYCSFGGVITTVGMETLGWYRYEGTTDVEGIGIEMEKMASRMNPLQEKFAFNDSECLDAEMFKLVADKLVEESGKQSGRREAETVTHGGRERERENRSERLRKTQAGPRLIGRKI